MVNPTPPGLALPAVMPYSASSANYSPPINKTGYTHTMTATSCIHQSPHANSSMPCIYEKAPAFVNKKWKIPSTILKFRQNQTLKA